MVTRHKPNLGSGDRKQEQSPKERAGGFDSSPDAKGVFIRLSPKAKDILEEGKNIAKEMLKDRRSAPKSYAGIIEKLLQYFGAQQPQFKKKILEGVANQLKDTEDLLARLHRAQHAFETKRFYFAIKTYNGIADELRVLDPSDELLDVCHFRLAHCWHQLSYSLRTEALSQDTRLKELQPKSDRLYGLAIEALHAALKYLGLLTDGEDPFMAQIKNYNMACCHSLKAQYIVESKLDPDDQQAGYRTALREAKKESKDTTPEVWRSIGLDKQDDAANKAAEDAFTWLRRIHSESAERSTLSPENVWIVESAREESDFLFLRSARDWKTKFDNWANNALKGASIATAIESLLAEEPLRPR